MAEKKVTLADIAREVGVSAATVSRALTNGPHNRLSEAKREAIFAAAARLGYQANVAARTLSKGRAPLLGVVLGSLRIEHFSDVASGVEARAREAGYQTVVFQAGGQGTPSLQEAVTTLQAYNVSGIVLCPVDDGTQDAVLAADITPGTPPIVLVERPVDIPGTARVVPDNRGGGWLAGRWLLGETCDRILYVGQGPRSAIPSVWGERLAGFRAAIEAGGGTMRECFLGDIRSEEVRTSLGWVCGGKRPGIFLNTLHGMAGLIRALDVNCLMLPRVTRLCGFDRGSWTVTDRKIHALLAGLEIWPQPITYSGLDMGRQAADLVLQRIKNGDWPRSELIVPVTDSTDAETPREQ